MDGRTDGCGGTEPSLAYLFSCRTPPCICVCRSIDPAFFSVPFAARVFETGACTKGGGRANTPSCLRAFSYRRDGRCQHVCLWRRQFPGIKRGLCHPWPWPCFFPQTLVRPARGVRVGLGGGTVVSNITFSCRTPRPWLVFLSTNEHAFVSHDKKKSHST